MLGFMPSLCCSPAGGALARWDDAPLPHRECAFSVSPPARTVLTCKPTIMYMGLPGASNPEQCPWSRTPRALSGAGAGARPGSRDPCSLHRSGPL